MASQNARDDIYVRMLEVVSSREEKDIREYEALLLAWADLNVLMASFWANWKQWVAASLRSVLN